LILFLILYIALLYDYTVVIMMSFLYDPSAYITHISTVYTCSSTMIVIII